MLISRQAPIDGLGQVAGDGGLAVAQQDQFLALLVGQVDASRGRGCQGRPEALPARARALAEEDGPERERDRDRDRHRPEERAVKHAAAGIPPDSR